jgi:DNA invertase Pin-like site-specific DNA recombinase
MELEKSTMKLRRVIALLRISTSQQDVARQRSDLKKLAQTYGLEIIKTLELFGVSGTAVLRNEQVIEVLREIEQPGIDGLVASAIDRIARPAEGKDYAILDGFKRNKKTLWTKDEGELKLWIPAAWAEAMNCLTRAYLELTKIRQRCLDGKHEKKAEGRHVSGNQTLPDGVRFDSVTGLWSYTEPEYGRVAKAYQLLLQDTYNLSEIERLVGWGRGRCRTLRNVVWMGIRRYPATEDQEGFEVALPLPAMLTQHQWALAQTLIEKRHAKTPHVPKFLAASLLLCECGRLYYVHADKRAGQHDDYFCGSSHRGGKACGSRRLRRLVVDGAILEIVTKHLTNPKFLAEGFRRLQETPQADTRAEREQELAKLAARRQKWIEQYDQDHITKQEFEHKMDAVTKATREIEARLPVAPPVAVLDPGVAVKRLVTTLDRFGKLPFLEQRATLQRLLRPVQVVDGMISEVMLAGSYLGELAAHTTSAQPFSRWCMPYC